MALVEGSLSLGCHARPQRAHPGTEKRDTGTDDNDDDDDGDDDDES